MTGGAPQHDVVVLLSGGIDSCACAEYYTEQGHRVRGLFVDYGQAAACLERKSARNVASHFPIPLAETRCLGPRRFGSGEVKGRNAFLVLAALMWCPLGVGMIAIGVHAGTPYYDCGPLFLREVNRLLDGYADGRVRCVAPFLEWDKAAILEYCRLRALPVELTYSCEAGTDPPCGRCLSCLDRRALDARSLSA